MADAHAERLEITVARGVADVDDGGSRTVVRGGEMATILGSGGRVSIQTFNSARWDAFDRWADERTNGFAAAVSSRQLPSELRPYSPAFDSYGRWDYIAPYGNVWFPSVGAEWRPYYTGSWRLTRYGWTWIGIDPWAWPTHHYGRWGFTGASWYWIPNRVWGPAWVSWAFVPGYVSWSPLGWDGRAAIGFSARIGDHPDYRPRYDPWRSWTIVPRDTFGRRGPVRTHAIDPSRLPDHTRRVITNAVPRGTVVVPGAAGNVRARPDPDLAVPRAMLPVGARVAPAGVRRDDASTRRRSPRHPAQPDLRPSPVAIRRRISLSFRSCSARRRRPTRTAACGPVSAGRPCGRCGRSRCGRTSRCSTAARSGCRREECACRAPCLRATASVVGTAIAAGIRAAVTARGPKQPATVRRPRHVRRRAGPLRARRRRVSARQRLLPRRETRVGVAVKAAVPAGDHRSKWRKQRHAATAETRHSVPAATSSGSPGAPASLRCLLPRR